MRRHGLGTQAACTQHSPAPGAGRSKERAKAKSGERLPGHERSSARQGVGFLLGATAPRRKCQRLVQQHSLTQQKGRPTSASSLSSSARFLVASAACLATDAASLPNSFSRFATSFSCNRAMVQACCFVDEHAYSAVVCITHLSDLNLCCCRCILSQA